jgi:hypothetical protein
MSDSTKQKDLGPLSRAAISLEHDFKEVERLNLTLDQLTKESILDLKHAQKLLAKFSEVGLRIGQEIQVLATALEEGRQRAEMATEGVSKAAALIKERQNENASISERFESLGLRVQEISSSLAQLREHAGNEMSMEERTNLRSGLVKFEQQVGALAEEAIRIRDEAHASKFKELERQATAMAQSLSATHKKIKKLADPNP